MMRRLAIFFLRVYQYTLSPAFAAIGVRCRHEPTCSNYAIEAYRKYPFWKATRLTAGRLGRCRPGGTHGFDPVP
ncbi:membrane protein insertion efficiency factor YidD [Parvularcula marina]|uniref:membrane protein insertion efficiency factor YidD n=1 Tax=Parvularcula marina TaxID=2292771 RepID=UPI0035176D0B